jgi:transcriptional regulator with XRE-family HTH domain
MVKMTQQSDESFLEKQLVELGNRIATARRDRGLAVEDVSKTSRVSIPTIARIEAGNGGVGSRNLLAVLSAVGLSPVSDESEILRQEELPLHPLHLDNEDVQDTVEDAVRLACERLDELFPGARREVDGISSEFQGLLKEHVSAMLRGEPFHRPQYMTHLKALIYSDGPLGREYSLKEGAAGYLVRLQDTERVLEDGRFRLARSVGDMYTSWDAAAKAVRDYVERDGHLPGPVRIVSGWWSGNETGVRFSAPAAITIPPGE